jgi:hypothetical protein
MDFRRSPDERSPRDRDPRLRQAQGAAELRQGAALEWIAIACLVVDQKYQREITIVGRKNIRHIAENFNWSMFTTVMVAPIGGGRYAIVDGQHRTTAAALCGIEKVPCEVIEAARGEQAAAFRAVNANTTRPHTVQLFHASVAAGEPEALRIVGVCERAGVRIARSLGTLREYETFCVGAIGKGIQRYGEAVVTLALKAIVHSGDGRPEELGRTIIAAVIEVLARRRPGARTRRRSRRPSSSFAWKIYGGTRPRPRRASRDRPASSSSSGCSRSTSRKGSQRKMPMPRVRPP